jgi:hypothetical protein
VYGRTLWSPTENSGPDAVAQGSNQRSSGKLTLGSAKSKKVLQQLCKHKDADVVHAAQEALAGRATKTMAISQVFASAERRKSGVWTVTSDDQRGKE